ncbi:glutathione S-transferase [Fontimonas thermophila]|uniref:Glutathione S-transferase n=1 Tax=Fontimonas thermophila TaxID=1076937 RepID=A0A1I2ITM4_9GAMM|nr:glutathione S-transferase N-terminal domain-containing protein [Fontimonas thermophila]SFF45782.1 glutathione S-transferase [Fontimonas thermophila]
MRLYLSLTSPYSRKVRVALIEQGIAGQVEEVIADPFNPPPELLAANPLSRIPTLVTDRGEALPDSSLILEYLQSRGDGIAPLPRGSRRWAALRLYRIAEGVIDAAVATVLEKRRPESIVYTPFLDRQAAVILRAAEVLNREAGTLGLGTPSIVEITTGVALGYLDFRLPYLEWRKNLPALTQWYEAFAQRPSMQQTMPPSA